MKPRRTFSHHREPRLLLNEGQRLRAALGLTQQDLAHLLEVSRAAVAMAECGDRALPWPQAKRLHALQAALRAAPPLPPPAPAAPAELSATDRDDLDLRRLELTLEARPLAEKLERQRVRLAQARRWQQVLPALRAAFAADNATAFAASGPANHADADAWLDRFERWAAGRVALGAGAAALWEVRLGAIAWEVAEITRRLGEAPAPA